MRLGLRLPGRRTAARIGVVDNYAFSTSVRHRLRLKHPELTAESLALVEAAARQWFRIVARRPKTEFAMPSQLVDDLWHEFMLHTREYADFCDAAFGRFLHHQPETAMSAGQAAANRSSRLLLTLRMAQQDEGCEPTVLPLLFRVDRDAGLENGRRYLVDCGGRAQCYTLPNTVCLQHLKGLGKSLPRSVRASGPACSAGPGSDGGACGGGCSN